MPDTELHYRTIDTALDGALAFENYRDACIASFGSAESCMTRAKYLEWLARRIEEFPDGHLIAALGNRLVGQLELQVPYGKPTGYINLFYIAPEWRRLGFGRRMHDKADRYFRSWEAASVQLHVSATNQPAICFYRSLGYRTLFDKDDDQRMRMMRREIPQIVAAHISR